MRFELEFVRHEITSGRRKREFVEDEYPQELLAEDWKRRNENAR